MSARKAAPGGTPPLTVSRSVQGMKGRVKICLHIAEAGAAPAVPTAGRRPRIVDGPFVLEPGE